MDLPPTEFSNNIDLNHPNFDWANWRQSREWKIFVAGYNAAVRKANEAITEQYNMGIVAERLFGK